ncbi:hypothetical protein L1049_012104 [Liquidambar formosana]|uniref:Uncharacterized protein n=1 Tax=Liquidambar formosana TaxID=63359 RepID=A0AAP0RZB2_LIQFO
MAPNLHHKQIRSASKSEQVHGQEASNQAQCKSNGGWNLEHHVGWAICESGG